METQMFHYQIELSRRRGQENQKLKKDLELLTVQHESSEASLRKRHQEVVTDLSAQLDNANRQRAK